ncbi:MAG: tRNA epoxyqueuosine(34) reductase QueG [Phycisphaerales bacterium]|jgi:epoxyqueuosine reductase|nr:tRNA epoxyqueuosine(34) reductase QueG [Phycisphaerales bacterium]
MNARLEAASFVEDSLEAGFAAAGVARCEPAARGQVFLAWMAAGGNGGMQWMERNLEVRIDPRMLLEGGRSIVCVADRYPHPDQSGSAGEGSVAAYARGSDYHRVMKRRLHALCDQWADRWPDASFRACVDTAPIMEREHAERAGLGRVGKNTMLIHPGVGSWSLLGEIITTLEIQETDSAAADPCGTCTRCIDACPTDALTPWSLDANRCIAALTIEQRQAIPVDLHEGIGTWLFGCDECQRVCPHNAPTARTGAASVNAAYEPQHGSLDLRSILDWSQEARVSAIAGTPMVRATLDMWRRNACIVAGSHLAMGQKGELRQRLREIAADDSEPQMIREAAAAALQRSPQ